MRLDHRTALVTGASKGVGKGIALALALGRAGCNIAVNYFITGQTIWVDGAAFTQPRWPHENYQN